MSDFMQFVNIRFEGRAEVRYRLIDWGLFGVPPVGHPGRAVARQVEGGIA